MLSCMESGICVVGFHTTTVRIEKYVARGLGIVTLEGTKIISPEQYYNLGDIRAYSVRGLNAIRATQCNTCHKMHHGNTEFINILYHNCESCWNTMGVNIIRSKELVHLSQKDTSKSILDPGTKYTYYFEVSTSITESHMEILKRAAKSVKTHDQCYKVKLPLINITALSPYDRRKILAVLGLNESLFVSNKFFSRFKRNTVRLTKTDPILSDISLLIKLYLKGLIYKTSFKHIDNIATLQISIYIPKNPEDKTIEYILGAITSVSRVTWCVKEMTPLITGFRYRTMNIAEEDEQKIIKVANSSNVSRVLGIVKAIVPPKKVSISKIDGDEDVECKYQKPKIILETSDDEYSGDEE